MKYIKIVLFAALCCGTWACSSDDGTMMNPSEATGNGQEGVPPGWITCKGVMTSVVTDYDAPAADATEMLTNEATALSAADATRAAGSVVTSWGDGSKIYMNILSGETKIPVVAVYSNTFSEWSFSFDASAAIPASGTMVAHFVKNAASATYTGFTLNDNSIVYTDSAAQFSYEGGAFMVGIHMKPAHTRLRLAGVPAQQVTLSGMQRASSYTLGSDSFTYEEVTTSLTVSSTAESGRYFTPYVYGRFNDNGEIRVSEDELDVYYERTVTLDEQRSGNSLWLSMPSQNYIPKGWMAKNKPYRTITISGVTFNMILVEAGTFQMGSTTNTNEQPVHSVTLTKDYYIGETEVTQELWQAVMGSNPSSYQWPGNYPVEHVSWNDCQSFITKLNSLTGLTFRLPTEAEWEFAARGGNKSQGYTYSGSNILGEVGCYDNYPSGHRNAKSYAPNELGIYDMSGNVSEWCQDWYSSTYYSSSPSTDPTGPASGSYRVSRGGSWGDDATCCRCAYRNYNTPSYTNNYVGLRLASQ